MTSRAAIEGEKGQMIQKRARKCRDCGGSGYLTINRTGKRAIRCLTCHGGGIAGKLRTVKRPRALSAQATGEVDG